MDPTFEFILSYFGKHSMAPSYVFYDYTLPMQYDSVCAKFLNGGFEKIDELMIDVL